jgi:DNA-directed RNA polymerase specialized sigma24 family protein
MFHLLTRLQDRWLRYRYFRSCKHLAFLKGDAFQIQVGRLAMLTAEPSFSRVFGASSDGDRVEATTRADADSFEPTDSQMLEAYRRLPRRQRRVLQLHYTRGLPYQGIARHLCVSEAQALRWLCEAVGEWRRELHAVGASNRASHGT